MALGFLCKEIMSRVSPILISAAEVASDADWQQQLQQAVRTPEELLRLLDLPDSLLAGALEGDRAFDLKVPRGFIAKMRRGDVNDPLLRQVLPLAEEQLPVPGYVVDPLEEMDSNPLKGLIHKYQGRVLLTLAPSCAVNCRYCFRRHFPYQDNNPSRQQWQQVLDYIRLDTTINEVIFSGGDPLLTADRQLAWLVNELDKIAHLKRLRVHTRLPIVIPQRIDEGLLEWLGSTRLQRVVVLHINHANEIDADLSEAVTKLKALGVTILNQSVLLRGVNDSVETLRDLSEALFAADILPYYLHVLDKTAGTAHFDCGDTVAIELHRQLQGCLPGFLVPKLVREVPGRVSKTLL